MNKQSNQPRTMSNLTEKFMNRSKQTEFAYIEIAGILERCNQVIELLETYDDIFMIPESMQEKLQLDCLKLIRELQKQIVIAATRLDQNL